MLTNGRTSLSLLWLITTNTTQSSSSSSSLSAATTTVVSSFISHHHHHNKHHRPSAYHHHNYHGTASRFLHTTTKDVGIAEINHGSKHSISSNKDDDDSGTTKNYIFGYGSLMCPESRQITNANLMNKYTVPVLIRDLQRQWCARTTTGYTAMGVQFTPGRCCTGILIGAVDADELADLDQREASYNRFSM
jgi:hypothetical protein